MKTRYWFYFSMFAGFVLSFGLYYTFSQQDHTAVLGKAVEEDSQDYSQSVYKKFSNETSGYSLYVPSSWTINDTDLSLVTFTPPSGAFQAFVDVVPASENATSRMESILSLEDATVSGAETVTDSPENIGHSKLYGEDSLYFVETIKGARGKQYRLSQLIKHSGKTYILTISHPSERTVERLKSLHISIFSSFIYDDIDSNCKDGFIPFQHNTLTFCHPDDLILDNTELPQRYMFSAGDERLLIEKESQQQWPMHLCNLDQPVLVAGFKAVRTTFQEDLGRGCGKLTGFATRITVDKDKDPWFVGLSNMSKTYENDKRFVTIEQSLSFK